MRKLFWILLLANVVLFAVMQRGWLRWGEQEPQAQPPLHGEMIRLLGPSQSAPVKPPSPPVHAAMPVSAPAPAPVQVQVPAPPALPSSNLQMSLSMSAPVATSSNTPVCQEWGDFSGPDLARAEAALSALQLGNKLSKRQIERDIGYWVYIPPLKNKAAVKKKVSELKALGISEYFVVQSAGHWRNAISLGVFKTRDAAQHFLDHVRTKGVHSARVGERASKIKTTIFSLSRIDAATAAKLAALQKDFAGSELKKVPCTLTR
jgi:hypothetical protein